MPSTQNPTNARLDVDSEHGDHRSGGHVWHTGDILGSMVLASVFTMSFVSILGLVLIWRDDAVEAAP